MIERIAVSTADGPIPADLAVPDGDGPWPGVVVIHDALGLRDDIRRNVARFADNGYLALAPDLYSRGGMMRCVGRVMTAVASRRGQAVEDIDATRRTLAARPDCTGKVGIAGFCMGGGFALVMGSKGFDASAPFYPSTLSSYDVLVPDSCPVVASYGRRDPVNIGKGPKLQRALEERGIAHDVKVYDQVGHSFANKLPAQPFMRIVGFGHDPAVTDDAYGRVFAFFDEHLGAPR